MRSPKFSYIFQHDETGIFMDQRFTLEQIEGASKGFLAQCSAKFPRFSIVARREFTGVLDKNGKEIYEGDLVVVKDYPFYGDEACEKELNYVGEVFWDEEGLRWYYDMHVVSNRVRGAACGDTLSNWKHGEKASSDWEIIGNIYENADLIK